MSIYYIIRNIKCVTNILKHEDFWVGTNLKHGSFDSFTVEPIHIFNWEF